MTEENAPGERPLPVAASVLISGAILAVGVVGMFALLALRKPPEQATITEQALRVEVKTVQPEDVPVVITGLGEAKSIDQITLIPEVAGRIIEIHPRLKAGEVIPKGETLFRIDPSDYLANVARAEAGVAQAHCGLEALRKQQGMDTDMLGTLKRTLELTSSEFGRLKSLYEKDEVGTQSGVEHAEMGFNQAKAAHDQLSHAVDLYPTRIREAESGLAAAEAALKMARNQIERTTVTAPFDARIKQENIEIGQVVAPGMPVAQLANDSALEIRVPLDSRDAREWLEFDAADGASESAWFSATRPVACSIRWTEEPASHVWQGTLARVEAFDPQTRTLTVVVRIEGAQARSQDADQLPLVDGMFCSVEIPGKTMRGVYRVPRWAVSFEGDAYVSKNNRLEVRRVTVLRQQGEESFLSSGLQPSDAVITTRVVNPVPNTAIETMTAAESAPTTPPGGGKAVVAP